MKLNQIHCGDCLQLMTDLGEDTIDLVITSPPYNVGTAYDIYDDRMPWGEYLFFIKQTIEQIHRVLKADGRCAINISHVVKGDKDSAKHFLLSDYLNIREFGIRALFFLKVVEKIEQNYTKARMLPALRSPTQRALARKDTNNNPLAPFIKGELFYGNS